MPGKELLIAFPQDGDRIVDPRAVVDSGLAISHRYGWAFLGGEMTDMYYITGKGRPVKKRAAIVQTRTGPYPSDCDEVMGDHGIYEQVQAKAASGRDPLSRSQSRNNLLLQIGLAAAGFVFMCLMGLALVMVQPGQGADDPSPGAAPVPQQAQPGQEATDQPPRVEPGSSLASQAALAVTLGVAAGLVALAIVRSLRSHFQRSRSLRSRLGLGSAVPRPKGIGLPVPPVLTSWEAALGLPGELRRRVKEFEREATLGGLYAWGSMQAVGLGLAVALIAWMALAKSPTPWWPEAVSGLMVGLAAGYVFWARAMFRAAHALTYVFERNDRRRPWHPTNGGWTWTPRAANLHRPEAFRGSGGSAGIVKGYLRFEMPFGLRVTDLVTLDQVCGLPVDREGFNERPAVELYEGYRREVITGKAFKEHSKGLTDILVGNAGAIFGGVCILIGFYAMLQFTG